MTAQTAFALVPTMYTARRDRALCIGLGTGRTAFALRALGFPTVDIAEIAPGHRGRRAELRPHQRRGADGPARAPVPGRWPQPAAPAPTTLRPDHGRDLEHLVRGLDEPLQPRVLSAGAVRGSKPDGVLQQWVQLHHLDFEALGTVLATVAEVFPYVSLWNVGGQGLITATTRPQSVEPGYFDAVRAHARTLGWHPRRSGARTGGGGRCPRAGRRRRPRARVRVRPEHGSQPAARVLDAALQPSAVDYRHGEHEVDAAWASFPPVPGVSRCARAGRGRGAEVAREDYLRVLYRTRDAGADPGKAIAGFRARAPDQRAPRARRRPRWREKAQYDVEDEHVFEPDWRVGERCGRTRIARSMPAKQRNPASIASSAPRKDPARRLVSATSSGAGDRSSG